MKKTWLEKTMEYADKCSFYLYVKKGNQTLYWNGQNIITESEISKRKWYESAETAARARIIIKKNIWLPKIVKHLQIGDSKKDGL